MPIESSTSTRTGQVPITIGDSALSTYSGVNTHMIGDLAALLIEFPSDLLKNAAGVTIGVVSPFEFYPVARIERLDADGGDEYFVHGTETGWERVDDDPDWASIKRGIRELPEFAS